MLTLKPIEDDLRCHLLHRGDKVELLLNHLIKNGYKFLEACKYVDEFDWKKYEGGKDNVQE